MSVGGVVTLPAHRYKDRAQRTRRQDNAAYQEGIADRLAAEEMKSEGDFLNEHSDADADDYPLYMAGYLADRDDLVLVPKDEARVSRLPHGGSRGVRLPAHRYLERAKAPETPQQRVWAWDIDETITAAPLQHARLASAVKALGDRVVCVTGHGPVQTRQELLDAVGFPYDEIVIVDPGVDGSGKAEALKDLDAWFLFDDNVAFGPEVLSACPVTFQYVMTEGDLKPKKAAAKAAKALGRD